MRIQRFLSKMGLASRRAVEKAIALQQVKINGRLAELGQKISSGDTIELESKKIIVRAKDLEPQELQIIKYHKPIGQICTRSDPEGRPVIFNFVPKTTQWILVGRLDINTSGLILLTNRGDVANKLMHPSSQAKRVYECKLARELTKDEIAKLKRGINLGDGVAIITDLTALKGKWYRVVVTEGRNRLVRRIFEAVGTYVVKLRRTSYAGISLTADQKQGEWQLVSKKELKKIRLSGISL